MKNLRISLMLFLLVLASGSINAMGDFNIQVTPGKNEEALVKIMDSKNHKYIAEVIDNKGEVVYSRKMKLPVDKYEEIFDFSKLDNGKYIFQVKMGDETELNNLIVNNGKASIIGHEEKITPYFNLNGKILELSYLNFPEKDLKLMLFDNDTNNLVYQENLPGKFTTEQALDLSKLNFGSYHVELLSGNNAYDYNFYLG